MPMSYTFHEIPVESIKVRRKDRQRRELKGVEELANSIKRNGLLHPIVVDRDSNLIAGERRLMAFKHLKLPSIPAHFLDELDPFESRAIELEENIKRVDLTWQESCLATAEYHRLRSKDDPEWTQERTADALGVGPQWVSKQLQVSSGLIEKDEHVAAADNFEAAMRVVRRKQKRAIDTELSKIRLGERAEVEPEPEPESSFVEVGEIKPNAGIVVKPAPTAKAVAAAAHQILQADFLEWINQPKVPKANFVHCDFPYGVKYGKTTYGGSQTWDKYGDEPEVFQSLLDALLTNQDKLFYRSSHFMFWFSMNYYAEVLGAFRNAGFRVLPFPLIWHKNKGLIPDPRREGRRVYEVALFGSLGDRKIIKSVPNLIHCPVAKKVHISEKPKAMLRHFFRMFVDDHSHVFDPTCGSGNALVVAKEMGAESTLGLDIDEDYVEQASIALKRAERQEQKEDEDALQT